jgi:cytochrome c oxidase subunit 2
MVDSNLVLWGQTIAYTSYVLIILSLVGWFAYKITKSEKSKEIRPALFYSLVSFLVVLGVSLHIILTKQFQTWILTGEKSHRIKF